MTLSPTTSGELAKPHIGIFLWVSDAALRDQTMVPSRASSAFRIPVASPDGFLAGIERVRKRHLAFEVSQQRREQGLRCVQCLSSNRPASPLQASDCHRLPHRRTNAENRAGEHLLFANDARGGQLPAAHELPGSGPARHQSSPFGHDRLLRGRRWLCGGIAPHTDFLASGQQSPLPGQLASTGVAVTCGTTPTKLRVGGRGCGHLLLPLGLTPGQKCDTGSVRKASCLVSSRR